jgi:sulfoxide reductase heme-binding subunit YedZ
MATDSTAVVADGAAASARARLGVGPRLVLANAGAAIACMVVIAIQDGIDEESLGRMIRTLTPIGFFYFLAAFLARPLDDLVGGKVTAWLVAHRRYLGLSFAAWHLPHWPIIAGFVIILGPSEFWDGFGDFALRAGAVLLVITLLAATSFDGAQRFLGMRLWSAIHTVGVYVIWSWFLKIYVDRVPDRADTHDVVFAWILVAALALRWIAGSARGVVRIVVALTGDDAPKTAPTDTSA